MLILGASLAGALVYGAAHFIGGWFPLAGRIGDGVLSLMVCALVSGAAGGGLWASLSGLGLGFSIWKVSK